MFNPALSNNSDPVTAFQSAMFDAGIVTDEIPIADGELHRFKVSDDKSGSKNGWYVLYPDGIHAGAFGSWKTGISETWCMKSIDILTPTERQAYQNQMKEAKAKRKEKQIEIHAEASDKAIGIWQAATTESTNHPYIKSKEVIPHGIKQRGDTLVIPLRDSEGILHSLQFIDGDGNKRFLTGGKVSGCYCAIGEIKERLYICEGFATGSTIHEATGEAVAIAFNTSNLLPVLKALREKYSELEIVICADNDQKTEGNPGVTKAREAAQAINAKLAIPEFADTTSNPTDFNDLYLLADHFTEGLEAVKQQLEKAAHVQQVVDDLQVSTTNNQHMIQKVEELAQLSTLEYEQVRKKEAKALDIRIDILDKAVREEKGEPEANERSGRAIKLYEPEPWDSPVNGAEVLHEAYNVIMRHMVIRKEDAIACVLWAVHAHLYDIFDHTPRLLITAPDAECGKTLLMTHMVGSLVPRPQPVELMKAALFFRLAESLKPTFLIDEMDVFIQEDSDLLAAVNSGWEPHGGVPRCVGEDNEVRIFSTHCPVAMAGVELNKKLPATTITRSIVISLERAAFEDISDEDIYNARQHKSVLINIGRKIARWSLDHRDEVSEIVPCLPPKIRNRLADKWIPLFKIANVVGGEWPKYAKAALFGQVDMSEPSKAIMLLEDIRKVMDPDEDHIGTKDMISRLCKMEDAQWSNYNFTQRDEDRRHISDRQVSNLLSKYNIHPKNVRVGKKVPKGYDLEALQNAWNRYIPVDTLIQSATTLQLSKHKSFKQSTNATQDSDVADRAPLKPAPNKECSDVADENRDMGGYGHIFPW